MIAVPALARTVLTDPRPAFGFLATVAVSALGLDVVLGGGLVLAAGSPDTAPALEAIVQLAVLSAAVASFIAARDLATSLLPEMRSLRALGASEAALAVFGAVVVTATTLVAASTTVVFGGRLRVLWGDGLARVLDVAPPPPGDSLSVWVSGAMAVVCAAGWWNGLRGRSRVPRDHRNWRSCGAAVVAILFVVPSVLAVTLAPQLIEAVRGTGQAAAADRLTALGSRDGPLVVMSAAAFGLVGAASIVGPGLSRRAVGIAARVMGGSPVAVSVGLRLAGARLRSFGAVVTLVAAGVGLIVTRPMTAAAAAGLQSERSGADLTELGYTVGPPLLIAATAAVGSALAQSRGTGSDLSRLRRIGAPRASATAALLVAAVAIGGTASCIGLGASLGVALIAVASGVDVASIVHMDPTVAIIAVLGATIGAAIVFTGSELVGVVIDARRRSAGRTRSPVQVADHRISTSQRS